MTVTIREMRIADAYAVWQLNKSQMGYNYDYALTQQKIEKLLNQSTDRLYVAIVDDQVVGYVHANNYDTLYAGHMKNIMGIAVDQHYTHQGIGKALLSKVEQWAKETGAQGVRLVSGATRHEAHIFYHHCGYGSDKAQINLKKLFRPDSK